MYIALHFPCFTNDIVYTVYVPLLFDPHARAGQSFPVTAYKPQHLCIAWKSNTIII